VGDAGPEALRFLRWLEEAGQGMWQILPLGPTGGGDSPYGALSAFAGSPLLVSVDRLVADGSLPSAAAAEEKDTGPAPDFGRARAIKERLLRAAWKTVRDRAGEVLEECDAFRRAPEQAFWLDDWILYCALREKFHGAPWVEWPRALALREPAALRSARTALEPEMAFHAFVQFAFFRQWGSVRREAAARGVAILGDVPIYVVHDSADVWAHARLFSLDASGRPEHVAGVPPDYFSETGQLWGYPLYRWDRLAEEGYGWWVERFRSAARLADVLRIDHFRGFAGYWEVPAAERTAVNGRWRPGPGRDLFDAVAGALPGLALIAEDLGTITPDVEALRDGLALPGMRVLQFAFSEDDSPHLPHRHVPDAVVYTGTHDNDTTLGWFDGAGEEERRRLWEVLGSDRDSVVADLVRAAYGSVARRAVVPMQDLLELPGGARMNDPASPSGNWRWRMPPDALSAELASRLRRLAAVSGRVPRSAPVASGVSAPRG